MTNQVDTIVVGAGIAGLVAAWQKRQAGQSVIVLEPSARTGGAIRSKWQQGYLLEYGPNTVMPNPELIKVIESLGLRERLLLADSKLSRHVLFQGKMHEVPMSLGSFFRSSLLSFSGKARLFLEPFMSKRKEDTDESLAAFAQRRLGEQATYRLLAPFVSGVWAGDIERLSAASAFPKLVEWEKQQGSLLKGAISQRKKANPENKQIKGLLSFKDGLEELPQTISRKLGDAVCLNMLITGIEKNFKSGRWSVLTTKGVFEAPTLFCAAPAHDTAKLIQSISIDAARALESIPYTSIAVVHLSYKMDELISSPRGFGFLVAPNERSPILGCLFSSNLFPGRCPANSHLLTVFIGGARHRDEVRKSDPVLASLAVSMLEFVFGARRSPVILEISRYEKAIPQYEMGHIQIEQTLNQFEKNNPGFRFIGNYRGGVSVGDVVRSSVVMASKSV